MGFRDDNEALRARIQTLESEKEQLRDEKKRLKDEKQRLKDELEGRGEAEEAAHTSDQTAASSELSKASSLGSLMAHVDERAARELAARQRETQAKSSQRAKAIARLRKRKKRVHSAQVGGRRVVAIERAGIRDKLIEQLPWGFGFAFVNPGIFIMAALAGLFGAGFDMSFPGFLIAALLTWIALLFSMNAVVARWNTPAYRLELTDEHFAFFKGRSEKPKLFGSISELEVRAPDPDEGRLHTVRVSDGRGEEEMAYLVADDVKAMNEALKDARGKKKKRSSSPFDDAFGN